MVIKFLISIFFSQENHSIGGPSSGKSIPNPPSPKNDMVPSAPNGPPSNQDIPKVAKDQKGFAAESVGQGYNLLNDL